MSGTEWERNKAELDHVDELVIAALEDMNDACYVVDAEWRFVYINQKAARLWKRQRDDLLGKNIWDIFPQDIGSKPHEAHLLAAKERQAVEFRELWPACGRWIEGRICPHKTGLSVYFHTILESKRVEERVSWVASFPEMNPNPVMEVDLQGRVYYRNPASQRLFPDLETTGLGHPFLNFSTTEIAVLQSQQINPLTREVHAAGIWFQQAITYLPENQHVRIYALDVSQRKQAEERTIRLQAVTERLSEALTPKAVSQIVISQGLTALGAVAGSVVLLSKDKTTLEVVDVVGYAPSVMEIWHRFSLDAPALIADVVKRGEGIWFDTLEEYLVQYPIAANTPNLEPGARAALPLKVEGHTIGAIGLSFAQVMHFSEDDKRFMLALAQQCAQALERANLYEQVQLHAQTLEQQVAERTQELQQALQRTQQAERAKSIMLDNVTHEMRTPLSSIIGFTDLILKRKPDFAKVYQYIQMVNVEARRLTNLINDFLDLQNLEKAQYSLRCQPIDLAQLIQAVITTEPFDRNGRHSLHLDLSPVPNIAADKDRIRQVLVNLLSNAFKYSPEGGEITIALRQEQEAVIFSVQDTGLGIPADEIGHLFGRFYRGNAAETLRLRGTGLGLALCKEIIQLHHGRIWAESPGPGQGATFSFALPIAQPA